MAGSTAFQRTKGKPYAETFRCPGGALCLDFCNSGQDARKPSGTDWIASFADLVDWLEAAQAVTGSQAARLREAGAGSPRGATQVWSRAIKFREALFRVLNAKAEGGKVAREDLSDSKRSMRARCLSHGFPGPGRRIGGRWIRRPRRSTPRCNPWSNRR